MPINRDRSLGNLSPTDTALRENGKAGAFSAISKGTTLTADRCADLLPAPKVVRARCALRPKPPFASATPGLNVLERLFSPLEQISSRLTQTEKEDSWPKAFSLGKIS